MPIKFSLPPPIRKKNPTKIQCRLRNSCGGGEEECRSEDKNMKRAEDLVANVHFMVRCYENYDFFFIIEPTAI